MIKTYTEAREYILGIPKFTKKNEPEFTKAFLEDLGDISKQIPVIHVAGTNGKGSVCALLRGVFKEAGLAVGMFISPHLVTVNERFEYDGEMISDDEFLECFLLIYNKVKEDKYIKLGYHPSYFEFLFFMSVAWFMKKRPDVIIYETGLGGRLDATNSLASPKLSVITEIGFDHMEYLGDTIEKIAGEKAGIIKNNVPVVFVDKELSGEVIKCVAKEKNAPFIAVNKKNIKNLSRTSKRIDFSLKSTYYDNTNLCVNSVALYQAENAALSFYALETLAKGGIFDISLGNIKSGFSKMNWPGRMEEVYEGIFIDGAHNEDGISAFLDSVAQDGAKKRCLLYSAVDDKRIEEITELITGSELFDTVILTKMEGYRATSLERLGECFGNFCGKVLSYNSVEEGFKELLRNRDSFDTCYAVGSLYLVGEIKRVLNND